MKPKYQRLVDEALQEPSTKELMTSNRAETDNEEWGKEVYTLLEGLFIEYTADIPEQLVETLQEEYESRLSEYFWKQVGNLKASLCVDLKVEK
jgi:hypothetical protein